MIARLTSAKINIEKIDEFINIFKISIIPAAEKQKGFSGIYFMLDRETGEGTAVTFWESEGDALANEETLYYREQLTKLRNLIEGEFIRELYEVSFQVSKASGCPEEGPCMFTRVTRLKVKRDKIDEGINLYIKSVLPETKKQKGFLETNLLIDRKTGKAVVLSLWESEEDIIASEENRFYQEQIIKALPLYSEMPIREGYELIVRA